LSASAATRDDTGVSRAPSSSGALKFSNPLGEATYGEGRGATGRQGHGLDKDVNTDQWAEKSAQDMMAPVGTPVRAATAGTIVWITLDSRDKHTSKIFGDQVTIRSTDGKLKTFYTHLDLDPAEIISLVQSLPPRIGRWVRDDRGTRLLVRTRTRSGDDLLLVLYPLGSDAWRLASAHGQPREHGA